ncbi:hypothetical protein BDN70DRAFT_883944 [Pholiota conissans]|uniref:Uncharacterized protein n=1 Tax=Pholiota conissans TaxID=109636 RepID=A0A9P5YWL4_9AGAR|nr:hypothetical protein BDN70DRAFT_883944 [Pholiota conissans]
MTYRVSLKYVLYFNDSGALHFSNAYAFSAQHPSFYDHAASSSLFSFLASCLQNHHRQMARHLQNIRQTTHIDLFQKVSSHQKCRIDEHIFNTFVTHADTDMLVQLLPQTLEITPFDRAHEAAEPGSLPISEYI